MINYRLKKHHLDTLILNITTALFTEKEGIDYFTPLDSEGSLIKMTLTDLLTAEIVVGQYYPIEIDTKGLLASVGITSQRQDGINHLIEFGNIADEIFWYQISRFSYKLNEVFTYMQSANVDLSKTESFRSYINALSINHGLHDEVSHRKFFPTFSKNDFISALDKTIDFFLEKKDFGIARQLDEYRKDFEGEKISIADVVFSADFEPIRPPGIGVYPVSVNDKEEAEGLRNSFSVVRDTKSTTVKDGRVERVSRELFEVPYEVEYQEIIKRAIKELHAAKNAFHAAGDIEFAHVLDQQIKIITTSPKNPEQRNMPWEQAWVQWNAKGAPLIDHVAGWIEPYLGFADRNMWQSDLLVQTEASKKLNKLVTDVAKYEKMLPYAPSIKKGKLQKPTVRFMEVLFRRGYSNHGSHTLANNLPNDTWVEERVGGTNTLCTNIMAAKQEAILMPLIVDLVPKSVLKEYDPKMKIVKMGKGKTFQSKTLEELTMIMFFIGTAAHEKTHFQGKKISDEKRKLLYKNDSSMWEEGRAEAGRLYFYRESIKDAINVFDWDVNLDEAVRFAYQTEIADMFRHIRFGEENAYAKSAKLRLAYLIDKGAIKVDDNEQFICDPKKMEKAAKDLFITHLKIITDGDVKTAKAFKDTYGAKTDVLQLIDRVVKRTDYLPKDIVITYN